VKSGEIVMVRTGAGEVGEGGVRIAYQDLREAVV
jgi:hypothetical protein